MTTIPGPRPGIDHPVPRWKLGEHPWRGAAPQAPARARIIIDNDFSGDPDDLYQLVHHLLSPSVDTRLVIGSHLRDGDPFDPGPGTADHAVLVVRDVFQRMGLESASVIVAGSERPLADRNTPRASECVDAIVAEALRDVDTPLFYVAGGGLTDLASAYLTEPRIAERIRLVWIGGREHEGLAFPPPNAAAVEYNFRIDPIAAQVVFNDSEMDIWQVPRDVYRQCLVSDAELRLRVATAGPLGRYLYDEVATVLSGVARMTGGAAETYALGDSPLVLLTALQSLFEPDTSSSRHVTMPTPALDDEGGYRDVPGARPMRVYTHVDTRLMFEDFYLKLSEFAQWSSGGAAR